MWQQLICPRTPSVSTQLYAGEGLLYTVLPQFLAPFRQIILVADETVQRLYAADLAKRIGAECIAIPSGEKAKTQRAVTHLLDALFDLQIERDAALIGMGGGSTTDVVGFVASIYMRGIPLILIPTTLLGMIDAAIGGKTAIDTPFGKNLIGTIYHPRAIFADFDTLKTLSEQERWNGLAELLKLVLIYDPSIWRELLDNACICKAMQAKIAVIEQDPTEQSLRRILNFGHTIGHALEAVSNYEMAHGQAVALGCVVEAHLSMQLGYLSEQAFIEVQALYRQFPLQLPKTYVRSLFLQALARDKKRAAKEVRFVLIDRVGRAVPFEGGAYCRAVSLDALRPTLDWMEQNYTEVNSKIGF